MIITIENDGPKIKSTNYWESENARKGLVYLSTNAGCVRLLVPDISSGFISEMKTGKHVIMSRGPWPAAGKDDAVELLFEDFTDTPFAIHLQAGQCDMLPDGKGGWSFAAWTREGVQVELPLKYRRVREIPWLRPWKE